MIDTQYEYYEVQYCMIPSMLLLFCFENVWMVFFGTLQQVHDVMSESFARGFFQRMPARGCPAPPARRGCQTQHNTPRISKQETRQQTTLPVQLQVQLTVR